MTSEVAVLNKACVALAADSAVTVTYYEKGEQKTRYFKNANKIFNLSSTHPVGLMTYAAGSLQGVPWEIIAKAYRQHAKAKSHDHLPGYAQDFFDFIASNVHLFPVKIQEEQFRAQADRAAAMIIFPILSDTGFNKAPDDAARLAVFAPLLATKVAEVEGAKLIPGATQADADGAIGKYTAQVRTMLESDKWYDKVPRRSLEELAKAAILGIYKIGFTGLQSTGLAFAGYGDKEYFPQIVVFKCSGMLLGKLFCEKEKDVVISQENASDVVPLAISEMMDTFIWGIGDGGLYEVTTLLHVQISNLIDELRQAGHIAAGVDCQAIVEAAEKKYLRELFGKLQASHRAPLTRVISNLSYSEMAELAETLVFMESMKERVTTPTESVSGPIDVAVISKGDGFIWIKRKHYFDSKLNPRFFRRHSAS